MTQTQPYVAEVVLSDQAEFDAYVDLLDFLRENGGVVPELRISAKELKTLIGEVVYTNYRSLVTGIADNPIGEMTIFTSSGHAIIPRVTKNF